MTIPNTSFSGQNARLGIRKQGTSRTDYMDARVTGVNIAGFERNVVMERTGNYFSNYTGFNPATITVNYILDIGVDGSTNRSTGSVTPSFSYMIGSTSFEGNDYVPKTILDGGPPSLYKVSIDFNDYTDTFGTLGASDEALKTIFYNAQGVSNFPTVTADGTVTGVIAFKVNPFNMIGSSNYIEIEKHSDISIGSFNTVETNYDSEMGY